MKILRSNRFLGDTIVSSPGNVGYAKKTMRELSRDNSFANLQTGKKVRVLPDGSVLTLSRCFGEDKIRIDKEINETPVVDTVTVFTCFCDCAITTGTISKSPASDDVNPDKWVPDKNTKYDGNLCNNGELLARFTDIRGLDFFPHKKSDNVYALAFEKDIIIVNEAGDEEEKHIRMPEVEPCNWSEYVFLSIEPLPEHVIKSFEEIIDG